MKDKKQKVENLKKEVEITIHKKSLSETLKFLDTNFEDGLSRAQVKSRLSKYGSNALSPPQSSSQASVLLDAFFGSFSVALWITAFVALAGFSVGFFNPDRPIELLYLGCGLILFLVTSGAFTYLQLAKKADLGNSFASLAPPEALVMRDGKKARVPATQLVIGDVVFIQGGNRVPADLRLFKCDGLKVDNSPITGETEPQQRSTEMTHSNPLVTENLMFFASNVIEGSGIGIIFATGDSTVMGRIANLATSVTTAKVSTITCDIHDFVVLQSVIGIVTATVITLCSLAMNIVISTKFIIFVGILLGQIPQGLRIALNVVLALSSKKMSRHKCLIKHLDSMETLGSVTCICSDKTGTLTQNRMYVNHFWYDDKAVLRTSNMKPDKGPIAWKCLFRCISLCSRAEFFAGQSDVPVMERKVVGDPSETGLLRMAEMMRPNTVEYRKKNRKVAEIPFNSTNKFQVSVHEVSNDDPAEKPDGRLLVVMKGAPERIVSRCKTIFVQGQEENMNDFWLDKFKNANENLGGMGERVLGFADFWLDTNQFPQNFEFLTDPPNFPLTGLRFLGLVSMIDPPKTTVPTAIETCRAGGVRVVMVTGDHPITAKAIARQVGIVSSSSKTADEIAQDLGIPVEDVNPKDVTARVISGEELKDMSSEELDKALEVQDLVFARTSPQQKLIIVEAFQRRGDVIAVTGDGVNDSPAIKQSNVGVSMGISGSDVAKDAADIILMNDDFASMVVGIEEGRRIFTNLRKIIAYILSSNIPLAAPFAIALALNIPLPIGILTVLITAILMDLLPSIAIGYEEPKKSAMKRPPPNTSRAHLMNPNLALWSFATGCVHLGAVMFTYFNIYGEHGFHFQTLHGAFENGWDSPFNNNFADSYHQDWTFEKRQLLENTVHSACFVTLVVMLLCGSLATRSYNSQFSLFRGNWVFLIVFFFCLASTLIIVYTPGLHEFSRSSTVLWYYWAYPLPFVAFLALMNGVRYLLAYRFWWFNEHFAW